MRGEKRDASSEESIKVRATQELFPQQIFSLNCFLIPSSMCNSLAHELKHGKLVLLVNEILPTHQHREQRRRSLTTKQKSKMHFTVWNNE